MKIPKSFNKMSLDEQESYLVKKHQEKVIELEGIKKLLAQVRGGMKIQPQTEERPDLEYVQ